MEYETRPKLRIPKTKFENFLDIFSLLIFTMLIVYFISEWSNLPDKIPNHFNATGEADSWSSKGASLLPTLIIGFVLWLFMSFLEKFPHMHNYSLIRLNKNNVEGLYRNSRMTANVIKNEVFIYLTCISWSSLYAATHHGEMPLGAWDLPIFLIIIFGTTGIFIWRMFKLAKYPI